MELVVAGQSNETAAGDTERVEYLDSSLHPYINVAELADVWHHVEADAFRRSGQSDAPDQQNQQDNVREQCREVDDLRTSSDANRLLKIMFLLKRRDVDALASPGFLG